MFGGCRNTRNPRASIAEETRAREAGVVKRPERAFYLLDRGHEESGGHRKTSRGFRGGLNGCGSRHWWVSWCNLVVFVVDVVRLTNNNHWLVILDIVITYYHDAAKTAASLLPNAAAIAVSPAGKPDSESTTAPNDSHEDGGKVSYVEHVAVVGRVQNTTLESIRVLPWVSSVGFVVVNITNTKYN